MVNNPKFCSQCASFVKKKFIENRIRFICPKCNIIFYQNPIPVAASVVVNQKGELLLVKRKLAPQKGKWCLPIGFAEIDETIQEAALRELKEETGIAGSIVQLLDAFSAKSKIYGDIITITYEVKKIGGTLQAGDDAVAAGWFSFDTLPRLAFSSNDAALKIFKTIHSF